MKKFSFLAVATIIAGAISFAACNDGDNNDGNDSGNTGGNPAQTDEGLSQSVLVANLPTNVKITTRNTTSLPEAVENCVYTKLGNEWQCTMLANSEDAWTVYLKFDKNGNVLVEKTTQDGGATWNTTSRFSDFKDFAQRSTGKSLFYLSLTNISGGTLLGSMTETTDSETICGHTCKKYLNPAHGQSGENAYWVDNESKLVFKEITQMNAESTFTFTVLSWDASVTAFDLPVSK